MNSYLGICAGASTITTVTIENNDQEAVVKDVKSKPHDGNPRDVLSELLAEIKENKMNEKLKILISALFAVAGVSFLAWTIYDTFFK